MEDDYGETPAESYNQGKAESTERYPAILHMVKAKQTATAKMHSAELECNSISEQIALLYEMLDMACMFDIQAEKTRLGAKLHRAEEKLQAINVHFIDWDKFDGWFWSQP
ncbi:hypothetical protein Bca4012_025249 [Brassica carinata]